MVGNEGKVALEATGVRKIYRKDGREMPVLDVERFAAREGEFITINGPSGCGQSTFLHIMAASSPPTPAPSASTAIRSTAPARTAA